MLYAIYAVRIQSASSGHINVLKMELIIKMDGNTH